MNHIQVIFRALVCAAVLAVGSGVGATSAPAYPCYDDECSQGMPPEYYGDYSDPGYAEDVDPWTARYEDFSPSYYAPDGSYAPYGAATYEMYEDEGAGGEYGGKSTWDHPGQVQFGSSIYQRNIWQQAAWCWRDGHISMWRAKTRAAGRESYAVCYVSNGPHQDRYGGGVGYWYVDVESYATFGCQTPWQTTLYYSPWVIVTYMGGEPGWPGGYGWTHS
jgi:hypothetical protein